MRLNKYIAHAGICSRREADKLIAKGYVQVNGEVVVQMGAKVDPEADEVRFKGEVVTLESKVHVLLHKPRGYVTTVRDPHHDKTVMDFVKPDIKQRIYPVGRLDKDTTGLLLLTNDGDLMQQLTHPSFEVEKVYHVSVKPSLNTQTLRKLRKGVQLEDGFMKPDGVAPLHKKPARRIKMKLHSGKKRIIKRLLKAVGHKVTDLDRVTYAGLKKGDLSPGQWRHLQDNEVSDLQEYGTVQTG